MAVVSRAVVALLLWVPASEAAAPAAQLKVTICHRTNSISNPYVSITVASDAVDGDLDNDKGQGDHLYEHVGPVFDPVIHTHSGDDWGDIIPVVAWIPNHPGLNWNQAGQDIWNNGCTLLGAQAQVEPRYTIAGSLYVDVDGDGVRDAGEPGIENVHVYGPFGVLAITDASGAYSFTDLVAGTYGVVIGTAEAFFNGAARPYFRAKTLELQVSVGEGSSTGGSSVGNNFDTEFLLNVLRADVAPNDPNQNGIVLLGNGHTIGFWKHQLRQAMRGQVHQVNGATLSGYLTAIEAEAVGSVFRYGTGTPNSRFQLAFDTMEARTSDAIGLLKKQLQGLLLNDEHGLGLSIFYHPVQYLVISSMRVVAASGATQDESPFTRSQILDYQALADAINNMQNNLV